MDKRNFEARTHGTSVESMRPITGGEYGWFKCTSKEDKKEQTFADFYGEGRVPFTVGIKFGKEGFFKANFSTRKL